MNPDGDALLKLYGVLQDASPAEQPAAWTAFTSKVTEVAAKFGGTLEAERKITAATANKWNAQQKMEARRKILGVRS